MYTYIILIGCGIIVENLSVCSDESTIKVLILLSCGKTFFRKRFLEFRNLDMYIIHVRTLRDLESRLTKMFCFSADHHVYCCNNNIMMMVHR